MISLIRTRLEEGDSGLERLVLLANIETDSLEEIVTTLNRLIEQFADLPFELSLDPYGLACSLKTLFGRAMDAAGQGDWLFAVRLLTRAVEAAAPHCDAVDDHDGEVMAAVEEGFERLAGIAIMPVADLVTLAELRAWATANVTVPWAVTGNDWDLSCLELSTLAARTEAEKCAAAELVERYSRGYADFLTRFQSERCALIVLDLLTRIGDKKAIDDYITEHLSFPALRKLAIENAVATTDYKLALALCREGIHLASETDNSTSLYQFEERLISVLDLTGDAETAKNELEGILQRSFSLNRYCDLKKRYPAPESWVPVRDRIISAFIMTKSVYYLCEIYAEEGFIDQLLVLVEKDDFLFSFHVDTIGKHYPEKAAAFLKSQIQNQLIRGRSRGTYASTAIEIYHYGSYAGKEAVEALFADLLAAYPHRPAMKEEFERVRENRGVR